MEGLELLFDLEDEFGILLPDDYYPSKGTAHDLYQVVLGELKKKAEPGVCLNTFTALRVRHALVDVAGLHRRRVHLDDRLDQLLPEEERRSMWEELQRAMGWRLPALRRPVWMRRSLTVLGLGCPIAGAYVVFGAGGHWSLGHLVAGGLFVVWAILLLATVRHAVIVEAECATVRALVIYLVQRYGPFMLRPVTEADERAVWDRLRAVLAKAAGVPADQIKLETRLREDLDLG